MGALEWLFFNLVADLSSGRELHKHFIQLASKLKSLYDHLNSFVWAKTCSLECFTAAFGKYPTTRWAR
jgi:hypothetical protein